MKLIFHYAPARAPGARNAGIQKVPDPDACGVGVWGGLKSLMLPAPITTESRGSEKPGGFAAGDGGSACINPDPNARCLKTGCIRLPRYAVAKMLQRIVSR